ncbi:hypothetical protein ACFE04_014231 [Oxalis oulophora]
MDMKELCVCREVHVLQWKQAYPPCGIFTALLERSELIFSPTTKMIPYTFRFDLNFLSSADSFFGLLKDVFCNFITPRLSNDFFTNRDMAAKVRDCVSKKFVFGDNIPPNTVVVFAADLFLELSLGDLRPRKIVKNPNFGANEILRELRNHLNIPNLTLDLHSLSIEIQQFRRDVQDNNSCTATSTCWLSEKEDKCSICLEKLSLTKQTSFVTKTKCSHLFHGDCIDRWLSKSSTCPMCRLSLSGFSTFMSRVKINIV